jgi:hypothetical protein
MYFSKPAGVLKRRRQSSLSLGRLTVLAHSEEMPRRLLAVGPDSSAGGCVNVCEVRGAGSAVVLWTVSRPGLVGGEGWGGILSSSNPQPPRPLIRRRRVGRSTDISQAIVGGSMPDPVQDLTDRLPP